MAIALDTAGGNTNRQSAASTHTLAANNAAGTFISVGFAVNSNSQLVTGVTYAGTAMSLAKRQVGNSEYTNMYYLSNPATGNNNIVISLSSASIIDYGWASYTGNATSSEIDQTYGGLNSGSTVTETITPTVSGTWMLAFSGFQRTSSASTNSTRRSGFVSGGNLYDSNGTLTSGVAFSMVQTLNAAPATGVAFNFKEAGGGPTFTPTPMLHMLQMSAGII